MSLLTIVQDACAEVGISRPSTVIGNNDENIIQMLALVNREGTTLLRGREGKYLTDIQREGSFTSVAAELQGDLSTLVGSDFRSFVADSLWDNSAIQQMFPIKTEAEWQRRQTLTSTSPFSRFRVRINPATNERAMYFFPAPAAGKNITFSYLSKFWCESAGGAGQERFLADDDTGIVSEDILTLGAIWRWKEKKGFDYEEDFRNYEKALDEELASGTPPPVLSLSQETLGEQEFLDPVFANVPEGGF